MVSDDLTALAAITMGALAASAVTFGLAAADSEASRLTESASRVAVLDAALETTRCPAPRDVVDFAIIRSDEGRYAVGVMVGPEGSRSGWKAESLESRLLRGR